MSILIRPTIEADRAQLALLHAAQGLKYELPDGWLLGATIEIDGAIDRAVLLRKTTEAYYLFDPAHQHSRKMELGLMLALQKEMQEPMKRVGVGDCHAWVPPKIAKQFGKLLLHLGWTRPKWIDFHFEVK